MKLERSPERWAKVSPRAIAEGSEAQIVFCIQDAKHDIAALTARVAELEKDAKRLDWLESQRYAVTDSQTYHNPHGEHVANGWLLESPHITLREAIDSGLLAKGE